LPGGAKLTEKMTTWALAVDVSKKHQKPSNFIEFYKSRAFDDSPPLTPCVSYALAVHISKIIKSIEFYRILQSRAFDDSPL
jgi:hypothetical protein